MILAHCLSIEGSPVKYGKRISEEQRERIYQRPFGQESLKLLWSSSEHPELTHIFENVLT